MARVLVVDDETEVHELYAELLEADGHIVVTAADGIEAEAVMRRHAPDVVVTDIFMDGWDGFDLIRLLHTRWPNVRIVAMSGGGRHARTGSDSPLEEALALGADVAVAKPIRADELFEAVRRLAPETS